MKKEGMEDGKDEFFLQPLLTLCFVYIVYFIT